MLRIEVNHKTRTVISLDPDLLANKIKMIGIEAFCEEFTLAIKTTNRTALEIDGDKVFRIDRLQHRNSSSGL